ncbi:hypothetical protein BgiMline_032700 [Biomphalaria glabrata]|nr:hypothetical protein BgiMline_015712 [Biomphalaria glabrata]
MAKGFRPNLVPPSHRKVETEGRRPCLCFGLSLAVTILVFVIFGVSGWNLFKHRFSKNTLDDVQEAALNDITDDFSATFCNSYKVSSSRPGMMYVLPEHARVNTSYKDTHNFTDPDVFKKLFLLKGTELYISTCRKFSRSYHDSHLMILVKGSDNYKAKFHHSCHSCTIWNVSLCENHEHKSKPFNFTVNYTVTSNDFYYLLFNFQTTSANLDFNASLELTHFDTRNAYKKCNVSLNTPCQFDLNWQSDDDVVIKFPTLKDKSSIYTECQIRLAFWICLFVALPVVTVLPITMLLACFLCRVRKRTFSAVKEQARVKRRKAQDKRTLVHSEVIPDHTDGTTIQTDDP